MLGCSSAATAVGQRGWQQLQQRPGLHVVPAAAVQIALRQRQRTVTRFLHRHDDAGRDRFPINEGLPLSLFHPFKRLPPDGTTLPLEEEKCDPEEERCKTPLHVYEARCTACSGTGWARAPSNGRRGHLGTCMVCHGLGYVRRTTSRFCPDDPDKHMTIARPLTWNGKFAARITRSSSSSSSISGSSGSSSILSSNGGSGSSSTQGSSPGGNGSSQRSSDAS